MDQPLLPRIASGDADAVSECISRYSNLLWSIARGCLADTHEVEDAVQEIFIELWKSAERYRPDVASETAFVTMIARRRLIDRLRQHGRKPRPATLKEERASVDTQAEELIMGSEEAERAAQALRTLPPAQQQVLELSILHGFTHETVSEHTGLPLGTVKSHIRRGLLRLKESLSVSAALPAESLA